MPLQTTGRIPANSRAMGQFKVRIVDYATHGEAIRHVREQVFIVEQSVAKELEFDGQDTTSKHVIVYNGNEPVGTGRMQDNGHIGRIAVLKEYRHRGIGTSIMKALIRSARDSGQGGVWLSSQCQAKDFYKKLGFKEYGDVFQEAGIDHIKMDLLFE